jgi:hypothetical protein
MKQESSEISTPTNKNKSDLFSSNNQTPSFVFENKNPFYGSPNDSANKRNSLLNTDHHLQFLKQENNDPKNSGIFYFLFFKILF